MRTLLTVLLPAALLLMAVTPGTAAPPPKGSQMPADEVLCAKCHGEEDIWEGEQLRLFISEKSLAEDVHFRNGVNCQDCHGGDPESFDVPEAHAIDVDPSKKGIAPFRRPLSEIKNVCGDCHKDQRLSVVKSVHAKAGQRDPQGRGTPMDCGKCHGEKGHGILPVKDPRSPVFLDHQVKLCGSCHQQYLESYQSTVHGIGLYKSGLLVTAACADCHGAHGIYYAADRRSTLSTANVAKTCGQCHRYVEERLERSVHGTGGNKEAANAIPEPGKQALRKPTCTTCHEGHHILQPEAAGFKLDIANRCGNCHADLSRRYAMSLHGQLTQLGYEPAAECSDCHGAHTILPVSDPQSPVAAGENRLATCRKCHPYAVKNFSNFDPHANYKDAQQYPMLHLVYQVLSTLLLIFFTFFVVHALLWFLRSFVHTLQHGGHRTLGTSEVALVRFTSGQRTLNTMLVVCFAGLTLTGLPLRFSEQAWAHTLARYLGGFDSTSVLHHFFAVIAICGCIAFLIGGITKALAMRNQGAGWRSILFGPDSPVGSARDLKDLGGMARWFVGLGPRPTFEAWTYWEKLDFWAFAGSFLVIGTSGLLLWYPNVFCIILPGSVLNVAKTVHSQLALSIASLVFIAHAFHTHFRPEKFPMDVSALTGLVSEEHLRKYRPDYVRRLEEEGKLDAMRTVAPSGRRLRGVLLGGFVVFAVGLCMLALILLASLGE